MTTSTSERRTSEQWDDFDVPLSPEDNDEWLLTDFQGSAVPAQEAPEKTEATQTINASKPKKSSSPTVTFRSVDKVGGYYIERRTLVTIVVIPIIAYIGWSYAKDFLADFMKQEATTPRRQFSSLVGLGGIDTSTKRQFKSLFCFLRTDSLARRQFASFVPFSSEGSLTGRQMISLVSSNEVTTSATRQLRSLAFLREVHPPTWLERITSRLTFS